MQKPAKYTHLNREHNIIHLCRCMHALVYVITDVAGSDESSKHILNMGCYIRRDFDQINDVTIS